MKCKLYIFSIYCWYIHILKTRRWKKLSFQANYLCFGPDIAALILLVLINLHYALYISYPFFELWPYFIRTILPIRNYFTSCSKFEKKKFIIIIISHTTKVLLSFIVLCKFLSLNSYSLVHILFLCFHNHPVFLFLIWVLCDRPSYAMFCACIISHTTAK